MKAECRPFRLSDAIILIASLAVGLGWVLMLARSEIDTRFPVWTVWSWKYPLFSLGTVISWTDAVGSPLLAPLTVGILAIRLRRPRPRWRRFRREPGTVACLIAFSSWVIGATASAVTYILNMIADGSDTPLDVIGGTLCRYPVSDVGLCVGVAWLSGGIAGALRPSACWIDRFGRVVGLGWVLAFLASYLKNELLVFSRLSGQ